MLLVGDLPDAGHHPSETGVSAATLVELHRLYPGVSPGFLLARVAEMSHWLQALSIALISAYMTQS
jgi:hypothetical protein